MSLMRFSAICSLALLASCQSRKPAEPTTPTTSLIPSPKCNLPAMPDAIEPKVAEATEDMLLISKADVGSIITYVDALHDWVRAASACLEVR